MPRYDVECKKCLDDHVIKLTFDEYDEFSGKEFDWCCPSCGNAPHRIVILNPRGIEWRTDGTYGTDNADPIVKWQREHMAESGDRSDRKTLEREKRRRG